MSDVGDELLQLAEQLASHGAKDRDTALIAPLERVGVVLEKFNHSASGSWLGYHANVYYALFQQPPPGAHFSSEWGLGDRFSLGTTGNWREYSPEAVKNAIWHEVGEIDLSPTRAASSAAREAFDVLKSQVQVALAAANAGKTDKFLEKLEEDATGVRARTAADIVHGMRPGRVFSRDSTAMSQGFHTPPHASIFAETAALRQPFKACDKLSVIAKQAGSYLVRRQQSDARNRLVGTNVFIGHGQSSAWKDLRDFIKDRLRLPWDEFNRVPVAGVTNIARLSQMLDAAAIAFLVMTGEDEQRDGKLNARMNVVHEAGLFQGRLGFQRAIILLEDGCEEFSNINGLGQIRFPNGNITAKFEDIRLVLEREGLIEAAV